MQSQPDERGPASPGDELQKIRRSACPCGGDLILSRAFAATHEAARTMLIANGRKTTAEFVNRHTPAPMVAMTYTCADAPPALPGDRKRKDGCGRSFLRIVDGSGRLVYMRGQVAGGPLW